MIADGNTGNRRQIARLENSKRQILDRKVSVIRKFDPWPEHWIVGIQSLHAGIKLNEYSFAGNNLMQNLGAISMDNPLLSPEFESGMRNLLGDDYENFLQSLSDVPPASIRINPDKACDVGLPQSIPWTAYGTYLTDRPVFTLDPRFHAGAYYVQEASSMFLEQALRQYTDVRQPLNVLDLCAAPGGKSTHLLTLLNDDSLLVANEAIRTRVPVLEENLEKWGRCNTIVSRSDPSEFHRLPEFFDVVVVDAPCSGEGLFRKDVNARQQWNPANVTQCAARQKRILADVWPSLKAGGILVYSTCTFNTKENEENVQWLCKEHGAEPLSLAIDPTWGVAAAHEDKISGYRFYPHKVKGEGFFLSVLRKTSSAAHRGRGKTKSTLVRPAKGSLEKLRPWINRPDDKHFFVHRDQLRFTAAGKSAEVEYAIQQLRTVAVGTAAATLKHGKVVPEHSLALSLSLKRGNVDEFELDETSALRLLRKEQIHIADGTRGFAVVTFKGIVLGWVNILSDRVNNLYPSKRRIRMALPGQGQ